MRKQRHRSAYCKANQRLCCHYTDNTVSTLPILPDSEISSLLSYSVIAQPGLCQTWPETLKTGFLTTRLKYFQLLRCRYKDVVFTLQKM